MFVSLFDCKNNLDTGKEGRFPLGFEVFTRLED